MSASKAYNEIMILEFTVENFRSIKEEQKLSFVPDASDHLRENLISTDARPDIQLLPSLLVYGGTGAGKTNLCKALEAFSWVAAKSSFGLTLDQPIGPIEHFRLDPETIGKPTIFGMTFLIGAELFEYKLACTRFQVVEESLRRKAHTEKSRWATIFHRVGNVRSDWLGNAPRLNQGFFKSVRDNGTVLSKAAQENIESVQEVWRAVFNIKVKYMAETRRAIDGRSSRGSSEGSLFQSLDRVGLSIRPDVYAARLGRVAGDIFFGRCVGRNRQVFGSRFGGIRGNLQRLPARFGRI